MIDNFGDRFNSAIKKSGVMKKTIAEWLGVTPTYLSTIIKGKAFPSERLIDTFCEKLSINRQWLETGEGDMEKPDDDLIQMADLINEVLTWESDEFRTRLIAALIQLPKERWYLLEDFIDSLNK